MPYQLGLPAHLYRRGLIVEETAGWPTRGSSTFAPGGVVDHWTAGPKTGDRPSLNVCINGRRDLPGPLCNVFHTRGGRAVVVAAGRANHAGAGGWKGLTGNSSVWGIESEEDGDGNWTDAQRATYPLLNAALAEYSGFGSDMVCGHNEWAPGRKVDIHSWTMAQMRDQTRAVWRLDRPAITRLQQLAGASVDGAWGPGTIRAAQAWLGLTATGRWTSTDARALQARVGADVDGMWGPASNAALLAYKPTTSTTTTQEDDMPITPADADLIISRLLATPIQRDGLTDLWPEGHGQPVAIGTMLAWSDAQVLATRQRVATEAAALRAELDAVLAALKAPDQIDLEAVREAARQGVADAVASIETTVSVRPDSGLRDQIGN